MQLPRYWRYIRSTNELSVFYNASVINVPSAEDVRLLGVRYLIVPSGVEPPARTVAVVEEADGYSLWELGRSRNRCRPSRRIGGRSSTAWPAAMDAVTRAGSTRPSRR